jgi:hypothetical protein
MSSISAQLNRNTRLLEFLVKRSRDSDQSTNDTTHSRTKKRSIFKSKAQKGTHKNAKELDHRVCLCSFHHLDFAILKFVLQRLVREHMNTMMGRKEDRSRLPEPASREAILKYNRTHNEADGPSKNRFQADFITKPIGKSDWNIRLFEIFTGDYVQKGHPIGHKDDLQTYFISYLHSLQKKLQEVARPEFTKATARRNRILRRKQTVRSTLSCAHILTSPDQFLAFQ